MVSGTGRGGKEAHLSATNDENILALNLPREYQAPAGLHGRELTSGVGHA